MAEAAIDYARQNSLNEARNQLQSPGQFSVPKNGSADNYGNNSQAGNYSAGGERDHVDRLAEARERDAAKVDDTEKQDAGNSNSVKDKLDAVKDLAQTATPMGAVSLLGQIDFIGDMPFVAAMGAALLKDLIDFVAAETVILSALFSVFCTIFIFMMLLLVGANGKKRGASKILNKILTLGAAGVADSIPGIDFLPIESATVAFLYFRELVERKNGGK
ncbi:MAG: hypothetical protein PHW24_04965 [Candidatus Moranbacteria bacterium]|nr:hypothetical protein [Candidatus Moranbacteria bacterium]